MIPSECRITSCRDGTCPGRARCIRTYARRFFIERHNYDYQSDGSQGPGLVAENALDVRDQDTQGPRGGATHGESVTDPFGTDFRLCEALVTEAEIITPAHGKGRPGFVPGYGICFGHNKITAISMAMQDRCLQAAEPTAPAEDQESVLYSTSTGLSPWAYTPTISCPIT